MDEDLIRKRQRELSKQQAIYVANRERGVSREQSAILAGYPEGSARGAKVEKSVTVQEELEKARQQLVEFTGITKEDVAAGLLTAANLAQTMADPQAMVRAWSELGKLLGHYAPEVKKHVHGLDEESRRALKGLPDDELHKLAKGKVIEGEFKDVTGKPGE